jgi:hypothetical protein
MLTLLSTGTTLPFAFTLPQRYRLITQSHRTRNRWRNLDFICECWNQRVVACKKADDRYFQVQERSADVGIHATREHNNVASVLRRTTNLSSTIQNRRRGILTSGVVLVYDNARPHAAARTRTLLEHFNWVLFDHSPYSTDLTRSDYHLLTYVKSLLRWQRFNNNEELIKRVKT